MGNGPYKLPIRGGNWNNGASAGVFALNLNNPRSNVNTNIGFRSALASFSQKLASQGTPSSTLRIKGVRFPSWTAGKIYKVP